MGCQLSVTGPGRGWASLSKTRVPPHLSCLLILAVICEPGLEGQEEARQLLPRLLCVTQGLSFSQHAWLHLTLPPPPKYSSVSQVQHQQHCVGLQCWWASTGSTLKDEAEVRQRVGGKSSEDKAEAGSLWTPLFMC